METVELYVGLVDMLADRVAGALGNRLETYQVRFPPKFVAVERLAQHYCSVRDTAGIQRQTGRITQRENENEKDARRISVPACLESGKGGYMTFEDDQRKTPNKC